MDFSIECACGKNLRVSTVDAGGTKRCPCGRTNAVPSLSELRRRAGQQRYDVPIADKLRYMFADGLLPTDRRCAGCESETSNVLPCLVECERPYVRGRGYWGTLLLTMFSPFWSLLLLKHEFDKPEVFGEELLVDTPLPLCGVCLAAAEEGKLDLRELLLRIPLYEQLFQEYPEAYVTVSRKQLG